MGHYERGDVSNVRFVSNGLSELWNTPIVLRYEYTDGRHFLLQLMNNNGTMELRFVELSSTETLLRQDSIPLNRIV